MEREIVSLEERYELINAKVTLDGQPAKIAGAQRDFATVIRKSDGAKFEWSWPTVRRVVANGGTFKS